MLHRVAVVIADRWWWWGWWTGVGEVEPSRLRVENLSTSGLLTDITWHLLEAGGGEGHSGK